MSEQTYAIEQDLKEAEAMVKALVPYVYEDQLYGSAGGGGLFSGKMPSLTIGALLMRIRRLRALDDQMTDDQRSRLDAVESQHDSIRKEWRVHYEGKLLKEAISRLNDMQPYFQECNEDPRLCANAYMPEALRRTIVQEILLMMSQLNLKSAELDSKINRADAGLRRYARPTEFIWASTLQPVYPKDSFWWLYSKPTA